MTPQTPRKNEADGAVIDSSFGRDHCFISGHRHPPKELPIKSTCGNKWFPGLWEISPLIYTLENPITKQSTKCKPTP